jgi:hypothetical protein
MCSQRRLAGIQIATVCRLGRRALLVALAAGFAATAATAAAQEYRTDNIDNNARGHRVAVQRAVKNPADYTANQAIFAQFFQNYYFPMMTRPTPEGLAELGKLRSELFKLHLWATTNEQLQGDLTKLAYDAMLKVTANVLSLRPVEVANPPYHPAVRYNAVLILGMLDEKYAAEGGNGVPKPYPPATKILTSIVDSATTTTRFPPPVILGALIGLERHAQYRDTMDPATASSMLSALLKVVNHDKPIQNMDPKAYAWLRLRAASAMAKAGVVGQNNAIHDALIKLIGSFTLMDDRCETAALLARLNYEGAKIDTQAALDAMFQLAGDLAVEEVERAEDYEMMRASGGGAFAFIQSATFGAPGEEEFDPYPRSHVLVRLLQLRAGLNALSKAVPEDDQAKIEALKAAIQPVIDKASDEKTISGRVAEAIGTMQVAISEATPPGEEPAGEEELDL